VKARRRREEGGTARQCALMESSWLRIRKVPRALILAAIETAIIEAGYDEETAQREAAAVWGQFWERQSERGEGMPDQM
jgi:hypothetical protein